MALNGDNLGNLLKNAVKAQTDTLNQNSVPAGTEAYQSALWKAIGNVIVNYFKDNAVVTIDTMMANGTPTHTHLPASGEIS